MSILNKVITSNACAIISKIIKPRRTNLLKNLYKSYSKLIPKKIVCAIKNTAEPTPKNKKRYFFLKGLLTATAMLLLAIQYLIKRNAVIIMHGLNIRYAGYVLAVRLIETPPSIYGIVNPLLPN